MVVLPTQLTPARNMRMLQHFGRSEPVRIGSRNHMRFVRFEQQFIVYIEEAAGPRRDTSLDVIMQDRVSCVNVIAEHCN
jgi:hypothetical protein